MWATDCFDNTRALSCAESHSALGGVCAASDTVTGALGEKPGLWAFDGVLLDHTVRKLQIWEHICLSLQFGLCVALIALSICHPCWPHRCHPCYQKVTFRLIPPPSQPCPATLLHSFPLDRRGRLRDICMGVGKQRSLYLPVPWILLPMVQVSAVSDGPIAHGFSHSKVSSFIWPWNV